MSTAEKPKTAFREGAAEVKEKLKSDFSQISRMARVRRFISLSPTMVCPDCDGARLITCSACGGEGQQKTVWNDEVTVCEHCKGEKTETCGGCFGRARVKNVHRKKFLWLLALGGVGWGFILFQLWGRDVLPEQSSKFLHGGGGGGTAQSHIAPRGTRAAPANPNADAAGGTGQPPVNGQPAPGVGNAPSAPSGTDVRGGQLRPRGL